MADIATLAGLNQPRPMDTFFERLLQGIATGMSMKQSREKHAWQADEQSRAAAAGEEQLRGQQLYNELKQMEIERETALAPLEERIKQAEAEQRDLQNRVKQFELEDMTSDQARQLRLQARKIETAANELRFERSKIDLERSKINAILDRFTEAGFIDPATSQFDPTGFQQFYEGGTPGAPAQPTTKEGEYLMRFGGAESSAPGAGLGVPQDTTLQALAAAGVKGLGGRGGAGPKPYTQPQLVNLDQDIRRSAEAWFESKGRGVSPEFRAVVTDKTVEKLSEGGPQTQLYVHEVIEAMANQEAASVTQRAIYSGLGNLVPFLQDDIKMAGNDPNKLGTAAVFPGEDLQAAAKDSGIGLGIGWEGRQAWSFDDIIKLLYAFDDKVNWDNPLQPGAEKDHPVVKFMRAYGKTVSGEVSEQRGKAAGLPEALAGIARGAGLGHWPPLGPSVPEQIEMAGETIPRIVGPAKKYVTGGYTKAAYRAIRSKLSATQSVAISNLVRESGTAAKLPPAATNGVVSQAVATVVGPEAAAQVPMIDKSMSPNEIASILVEAQLVPPEKAEMVAKEILRMIQQAAAAQAWVKP